MIKGIRPIIVVVALILGLAGIFGTQYLVKTYHLEEPFKEKVLSIEGIENVKLVDIEKGKKVFLTVGASVELNEAFLKVQELAAKGLKGEIDIEIEEKASSEIKEIYNEMHFAIYEGITTGKFTTMMEHLDEIGTKYQVQDLDVQMDNQYVYLKLNQNGETYCKIVPRQSGNVIYVGDRGGESKW